MRSALMVSETACAMAWQRILLIVYIQLSC